MKIVPKIKIAPGITTAGALAAALLLSSTDVQADSSYDLEPTVRPYTGLGLGGHYSYAVNQDTDDGAHMGGAKVRVRSRYFGAEGAVAYRNEEFPGGVDLKTWPITASFMAFPLPALYGSAGIGWYNSTLEFPAINDQTDSDLGYHFGLGVELPIAPAVRLTGDARWHFVDYKFQDIPESIGEVDSDVFATSVGLMFYLQ